MESPKFFKLSLDSTRSFKDLSFGEKLFNERKIKEALEFFKKIEKESELFKKTYYAFTGIFTLGVGLPIAGYILSDSLDPIYKGIGFCYFWLGDNTNSIKYLNKIYKKNHEDNYIIAWANYNLGSTHLLKNIK